ncbi:MAG: sel1 repeat family protein [Erysipelotrichaceae bacterium]|nr:sel1 repeat family protein [Erysipelotrichaceae bacterium]
MIRETVKKHLYNILYSLEIDCEYEKFFAPSEISEDIECTESSFISSGHLANELAKAESLMNNGAVDKALELYTKLAKSGSPVAMYNLGMCYYDGIGTEKSVEKGLKWIEAAAGNGDARAKIKLADHYYYNENIFNRNFSKAYELYSGPGVLAVNPSVKRNIVSIINQKKTNFIVLILGGILTFLCGCFYLLIHSLFTMEVHWLVGVYRLQ